MTEAGSTWRRSRHCVKQTRPASAERLLIAQQFDARADHFRVLTTNTCNTAIDEVVVQIRVISSSIIPTSRQSQSVCEAAAGCHRDVGTLWWRTRRSSNGAVAAGRAGGRGNTAFRIWP